MRPTPTMQMMPSTMGMGQAISAYRRRVVLVSRSSAISIGTCSPLQGLTGADRSRRDRRGLRATQGPLGLQGRRGLRATLARRVPQGRRGHKARQGRRVRRTRRAQGDTGRRGPPGRRPQGPQGIQGPQGPVGITFRGAWDSRTSYVVNDTVTVNGETWVATAANTEQSADRRQRGVDEACGEGR